MIAKYFWDLHDAALKETARIVRHPQHPMFPQRMVILLSRCDTPKALFAIVPRRTFIESWPRIRTYWAKRARQSEARDWWETLYERLVERDRQTAITVKGGSPAGFRTLGRLVREARLAKGLSQRQVAFRVGMSQPDISRVEEGRQNVTLSTLMRLGKVLGLTKIEL